MICTLSKHEAESKGFADALMLDHEGNVAEATGANIFFKDKQGALHTPIPDSFLDGITRQCVIGIAKSKGITITERKIKPNEMSNFIGCFFIGLVLGSFVSNKDIYFYFFITSIIFTNKS